MVYAAQIVKSLQEKFVICWSPVFGGMLFNDKTCDILINSLTYLSGYMTSVSLCPGFSWGLWKEGTSWPWWKPSKWNDVDNGTSLPVSEKILSPAHFHIVLLQQHFIHAQGWLWGKSEPVTHSPTVAHSDIRAASAVSLASHLAWVWPSLLVIDEFSFRLWLAELWRASSKPHFLYLQREDGMFHLAEFIIFHSQRHSDRKATLSCFSSYSPLDV